MLLRGAPAGPQAAAEPPVAPVAAAADHQLLDEVAERVRLEYVDPVAPGALEQAAVEGMIASLDPHSSFLDASELDEMRVTTAGSYSGVGIEVTEVDGSIVVVAPIEGSPAERAGVRAGDVLVEVDGVAIRESDWYVPGDETVSAEVLGHRVGLSICYDLRFPELYRRHADRGAEILTVPASFTATSGVYARLSASTFPTPP